jgi:hypothetical protein
MLLEMLLCHVLHVLINLYSVRLIVFTSAFLARMWFSYAFYAFPRSDFIVNGVK